MSPLNPDRAVRQVVVDLAALHPDDVGAILDELDSEERRKIEGLLREYEGVADIQQTSPERPQIRFDSSQLSPWLVERLGSSPTVSHEMTSQAHQVLSECAIRLCPPVGVEAIPAAEVATGMLSRLFSGFPRNRKSP
jgi:hypothetical protein